MLAEETEVLRVLLAQKPETLDTSLRLLKRKLLVREAQRQQGFVLFNLSKIIKTALSNHNKRERRLALFRSVSDLYKYIKTVRFKSSRSRKRVLIDRSNILYGDPVDADRGHDGNDPEFVDDV
eukprot:TRINITY_DN6897_c0_g1_i1.p1 TRINITY_DN6897_c0_g1~~TRINITY_DN6897_c0_g1_i1.p1  ORF type:complete len:123 (-),score=17.96 TRINITY_DN6897_c0_g1_i1:75-443(-)